MNMDSKAAKERRNRLGCVLAAAAFACLHVAGSPLAAELLMLERPGCLWCERWNREIGVMYERTEAGQKAPLRRVDVTRPLPGDLHAIAVDRFTPTFILTEDGNEVDRLRGYPGDLFFWPLLDDMLAKLPPKPFGGGAGHDG